MALGFALAVPAHAVVWIESIDGDLSGSFSTPTAIGTFDVGTHSIIGGDSNGNRDFFSFTVPEGASLVSIFNFSYVGADGTAFIGIDSGIGIDGSNLPGNLLGYAHFGSGPGTVGTEIIDDIAAGAGAAGFTPPLGAGTYTVWMQQGGPAESSWQMDFTVVPEPTIPLLLLSGAPWLIRRRR